MAELSHAICLYAHFHKQAANYFSNVNKNTMISGLWVPLKSVLAHNIWNVLLKPRGSSRCCVCTSLLVPVAENIWSESLILCLCVTRAACPLPREMGTAGHCHCLTSPVSLAVLAKPRLVLSLAPMHSEVQSRIPLIQSGKSGFVFCI